MFRDASLVPLRVYTTQNGIDDVKALLLVGGLGTRLRAVVPSVPKALASVGNQPFLELLVWQLRSQGIRRLVMCTGYLGEQIEDKFSDGRLWDVTIEYSKESRPLGTAGAIKLAQPYLREASDFVVMNGDSFAEVDLRQLIGFHREHGGPVSMAVVRVDNAARYGTVQMDGSQRVIGYSEKTGKDAAGMVNAGVYVFSRAVFGHIPEGPASLERDVLPSVLSRGVYGLEHQGMFIDIGTPEDYARVQVLRDKLYETTVHYSDKPGYVKG
jgi:D-glycero-alpha-D-manno-heptose 1-phosphate guanylyltransferase